MTKLENLEAEIEEIKKMLEKSTLIPEIVLKYIAEMMKLATIYLIFVKQS